MLMVLNLTLFLEKYRLLPVDLEGKPQYLFSYAKYTLSNLALSELILCPTKLLEGHFQCALSTRPEDNPDKHFSEGYLESCFACAV